MRLINILPHSVIINNREIYVNVDYRLFVQFEIDMQGNDTKQAIKKCLSAFYPAFILKDRTLYDELIDKFIWFYKCGIEKEIKEGNGTNIRAYDYEADEDYIYSAFYETYKIDLSKAKLHWWQFKALLKGLPSECEFCKIKSYRVYTGKDKNILELKEYYKLPPTQKEINDKLRHDKLYEALK